MENYSYVLFFACWDFTDKGNCLEREQTVCTNNYPSYRVRITILRLYDRMHILSILKHFVMKMSLLTFVQCVFFKANLLTGLLIRLETTNGMYVQPPLPIIITLLSFNKEGTSHF